MRLAIGDGLSNQVRYAERHKQLGLCRSCPNQAMLGHSRCRKCQKKHQASNRRRLNQEHSAEER